MCQNLLKIDVPQNYDRSKVSSMVPIDDNIWCIPHYLKENEIKNDMGIACAHLPIL